MLGTVFHYAVWEPSVDHRQCLADRNEIIAMHERMGYRRGGAYNGHFCIHGESWISYLGPNQASGNGWANLNLHAWCYIATVGTPVTLEAQQAAFDLTLFEPTGRDQIYPHSAFFPTSCCGDPLRDWIYAGALPPVPTPPVQEDQTMLPEYLVKNIDDGQWHYFAPMSWETKPVSGEFVLARADFMANGESNGPSIMAIAGERRDALARLSSLVTSAIPVNSGGGATPAQVEAIVQGQLNKTKLASG